MSTLPDNLKDVEIIDAQTKLVSSSAIKQVAYSAARECLIVWFKDKPYIYFNVPLSVFNGLMSAESKGRFLQTQVINADYDYSELHETNNGKYYLLTTLEGIGYRIKMPVPAPLKPAWARGLLCHTLVANAA